MPGTENAKDTCDSRIEQYVSHRKGIVQASKVKVAVALLAMFIRSFRCIVRSSTRSVYSDVINAKRASFFRLKHHGIRIAAKEEPMNDYRR